mgnify:FL=1
MYEFSNRVVWVTGSSTGIGRAAALAFARHGADVVVHANQSVAEGEAVAREIEEMGRKSLLVLGDVADRAAVQEMAARIKETFGRVDVLMNNAGSLIRRVRFEEADDAIWDRVMNVNLKSVFYVSQAVLPLMKPLGKGCIINVSSIAARTGGGPGSFIYAAAKGGVTTLTRGMARELAEYDIRVNAIAPGVISTPFHDRFSPPPIRESYAKQILLGREGTAEETAWAALFLASDQASYITGEMIDVNGGQLMS